MRSVWKILCRFLVKVVPQYRKQPKGNTMNMSYNDAVEYGSAKIEAACANIANYSMAKNMAHTVLSKYNITKPPVDVMNIVKKEGLNIVYFTPKEEGMDILGFLDLQEKAIYVNSLNPVNRQTFTMAHELGHWFMHKQEIQDNPNSYIVFRKNQEGNPSRDRKEAEANFFAASLLVPYKFLDEYYGVDIPTLSKIFMVSPSVIENRLKNG